MQHPHHLARRFVTIMISGTCAEVNPIYPAARLQLARWEIASGTPPGSWQLSTTTNAPPLYLLDASPLHRTLRSLFSFPLLDIHASTTDHFLRLDHDMWLHFQFDFDVNGSWFSILLNNHTHRHVLQSLAAHGRPWNGYCRGRDTTREAYLRSKQPRKSRRSWTRTGIIRGAFVFSGMPCADSRLSRLPRPKRNDPSAVRIASSTDRNALEVFGSPTR